MLVAAGRPGDLLRDFSRQERGVPQHLQLLDARTEGRALLRHPVFRSDGRTAALELAVHTDLDNNWAYFNFALINEDTGHAYDFGREVSYYYGADSDGAWSEGCAIRRRLTFPPCRRANIICASSRRWTPPQDG